MSGGRAQFASVDDYIASFPEGLQERMQSLRAAIRAAEPEAAESISYQIPAYTLHGALIYFAGFRSHIGVYPAPRGAPELAEELAAYKGGKGTIQIPHSQPLPLDLIARMVRYRAAENRAAAAARGTRGGRRARGGDGS